MPTYLSPGVFTREIDLSLVPSNTGPLRPVFVGTAKKGPMNVPTLVANPQQFVDIFGEPFPTSYLGYAALSYFEEGNQAYIVRVGIEHNDALVDDLQNIAIDTSGANVEGWGRIPIFTGIDYGKINFRTINSSQPYTFHDASVTNINYSDHDLSSTDGATTATLVFTSTAFTGSVDDTFIVLITGDPGTNGPLEGATYDVIRNSDNVTVKSGTLTSASATASNPIDIGQGLVFYVSVPSGNLEENDTFRFTAIPDNRDFSVSVEGGTANTYSMPATSYTTVSSFVSALNALLSGEDYAAVVYTNDNGVEYPQLRTDDAGRRIQLMSTDAFAAEVGTSRYVYDIPRSHFLGTDVGTYAINTTNNRLVVNVIPNDPNASTETFTFTIPSSNTWEADDIVANIDIAGTKNGDKHFEAVTLTIPGGTEHVLVQTTLAHYLDQIKLVANASNIKTLRFAEEIGVQFPYSTAYRGFSDSRVSLPSPGESNSATPLSCELDSGSAQCTLDSAYFSNIVGWLVATSPGTWVTGYTVSVELQPQGLGDMKGRYRITIFDADGVVVELIDDVTFDQNDARYIGNVVNPGSTFGGLNGNEFVNWEPRPAYLANDPDDTSSYEVRDPSQFGSKTFSGQADGIPTDAAYSSELDAAVIGNSAESTGIFAVQNAETFDANILATPGFSSGAVIGQCLQLASSRGDMVYIVDPPFGLKPQQAVDWHNGMLTSDLSAAINSSYGALYWSWIRIFDQFNTQNIWVPPSGHIAAVYSRTARDAEQWYAPAGLRRGAINTALDIEYNPSQGERDLLYGSSNSVNPIVNFPQDGITVWGQRTLQRNETALSRVNVRMLLNYIKKNAGRLLRNYVFEPNDAALWVNVQSALSGLMNDLIARRGVTAYKVVCDETNNTPARRDANQLHVAIFIQPTRSVEIVVLNLIVLRSSASFNSEETLAAAGLISNG